jgi:hypothetical protein
VLFPQAGLIGRNVMQDTAPFNPPTSAPAADEAASIELSAVPA